jgi:hypothetical protein
MGQAELSGSLTLGPSGGGTGTFPTSQDVISLSLTPSPKQAAVMTSGLQVNLNSPSAYVTLPGIGAGGVVQQCVMLYLRSDTNVMLRLTFNDPAGGADIVSVVPLCGMKLEEYQQNGYLKLLEAKGAARLEYAAAGPS